MILETDWWLALWSIDRVFNHISSSAIVISVKTFKRSLFSQLIGQQCTGVLTKLDCWRCPALDGRVCVCGHEPHEIAQLKGHYSSIRILKKSQELWSRYSSCQQKDDALEPKRYQSHNCYLWLQVKRTR